jgi:inhibitor of KinA sporulation pathway (predicted exonuclease)
MNYIIFDIEATCWRDNNTAFFRQETIEIGACKLDEYGEITERFSQLIRPVLHPSLSLYCKDLTGIQQEEVNRAATFPTVIELFQDFIDPYEDDYVLVSWGSFDKRQIVADCERFRMESDWIESYFLNLREQYRNLKKLKQAGGLRTTVKQEGFDFTGTNHRALADAENLAKIFAKYLGEWQF